MMQHTKFSDKKGDNSAQMHVRVIGLGTEPCVIVPHTCGLCQFKAIALYELREKLANTCIQVNITEFSSE